MDALFVSPSVCIKLWLWWVLNEPAYCRGWMYGIIRGHFVPLEGKFPPIALVIARTTLNVTARQRPPNVRQTTVCPSFKNLLSNFSWTLLQFYFHRLRKGWRSVWEFDNKVASNLDRHSSVVWRHWWSCCCRSGTERDACGGQRICFSNSGSAHFHVSWLSDFVFCHKPYIDRFTNRFSIHS